MITFENKQSVGTFILRIASSLALLAHGPVLKLAQTGMPYQIDVFERLGFPGPLAYLVLGTETIAGLMLLLGYRVRIAAAAALIVMLGATYAHSGNGWLFALPGGGWEFPAFWSAALVVQVFLGAGMLSLEKLQPATLAEHLALGTTLTEGARDHAAPDRE